MVKYNKSVKINYYELHSLFHIKFVAIKFLSEEIELLFTHFW